MEKITSMFELRSEEGLWCVSSLITLPQTALPMRRAETLGALPFGYPTQSPQPVYCHIP
jgi:hypothetical protein